MTGPRIVLFERDDLARELYTSYLVSEGFRVRAEALFDATVAGLRKAAPAVVVAGVAPGGPTVAQLAAAVRRTAPQAALVVLLGREAVDGALRALRDGALEALTKPVAAESLCLAVRRALQTTEAMKRRPDVARALDLFQAGRRLQRAINPDEAATDLLEEALRRAGATAGAVFLDAPGSASASASASDKAPRVAAARGLSEEQARTLLSGFEVPPDAATPPPQLDEATPKPRRSRRPAAGDAVLVAAGEEAGATVRLLVVGAPRAGSAEAVAPLPGDTAVIADLDFLVREVAFALGPAARLAGADDESMIDPLTGLRDVRHLHRALADAVARARAQGARLALVSVGVDRLDEAAAAHGPLVRSQALVEVARLLARTVRDLDLVTRSGTEEFSLVLSQTDGPGAERAAERLRVAFEQHRFLAREGLELTLSISVGVAAYPDHAATAPALLAAADRARLTARESGNAIEVAPAPTRRGARR